MSDTIRTLTEIQTLLADNTEGNVSAQDLRDAIVSCYVSDSHTTATPASADILLIADDDDEGNVKAVSISALSTAIEGLIDANRLVDHSQIAITAATGGGLGGGGTIEASRSLYLDPNNLTSTTVAAGDLVPVADIDAGNAVTKVTALSIAQLLNGTAISATSVAVDNVTIDGNSISAIDTNGDLELSADGAGHVVVGAAVPQATYSMCFSGSPFGTAGDAQVSHYVLRGTTTDANSSILNLDDGFSLITIPYYSTCIVEAHVVGRRIDAPDEGAGYVCRAVLDVHSSGTWGDSARLIGSSTTTTIAEDNSAWNAGLYDIGTNISPFVVVQGEAGKTIRWVAYYTITTVSS